MDADADWRPPPCRAYTYAACIHLLASASLLTAAYLLFGAQGAAWALGVVCLSCLAVPFIVPLVPSLRPRPASIATDVGGVGLGVDAAALPAAFTFKIDDDDQAAEGSGQCSICLSLVRESEFVRRLPACGHLFHAQCIDKWLRAHPTCLLCRAEVRAAAGRPELPA